MPGVCSGRGRGWPDSNSHPWGPQRQRVIRTEKGLLLGPWPPQKKMTSSLPASSLAVSGVVGSEEAGDAGGRGTPPDLKTSGGVAAGAGLGTGLGAGKQGSAREMGHTSVRSRHN